MTEPASNPYWVEVDPRAPNNTHAIALDLVGANKRVLELGCAAGHVTRALVEQGCSVVGLEVDPTAAAFAAEVADEVHVVDLSDASAIGRVPLPGHFDVVLAGDVLEHLVDPLATLRACRPMLGPGGYVVLSLPNIAHADVKLALLEGRFPYGPQGLLDRTHLRFFTLASVKELVRDAGFMLIDVRRVVAPVFATELGVEERSVTKEVLAAALADDEAETYQFVVRAVVHDGDSEMSALADRVVALGDELHDERRRRITAEQALDETLRHLEAQAEELDQLTRVQEDLALARADATAIRAELAAVRATRSYRWLAPLRAVRRRLP